MPPGPAPERRGALPVAALIGVVFAAALAAAAFRPLWNPDETRYSLIPLTMLQSGDWVVPRLNGVPYFEKPVFYYWLVAASYKLLGFSEWAGRLVSILSGASGAAAVYLLGRAILSPQAALFGALIACCNFEYMMLSGTMTTDATFSALLLFVWLFLWELYRRGRDGEKVSAWLRAGFWGALSLAFLTKGPLAFVLCGGTVAFFCAATRSFRWLSGAGFWFGAAVFTAVNAPWHTALFFEEPRGLDFFYVRENFQAFSDGQVHHPGPALYYFYTLFGGLFPFAPLVFWAVPALVSDALRGREKNDGVLFCLSVCAAVLGFFSVAAVKLHTYVLPMFGALGLLGAHYVLRREQSGRTGLLRWAAPAQTLVVLAAAGLPFFVSFSDTEDYRAFEEGIFSLPQSPGGKLWLGGMALALISAAALSLCRKYRQSLMVLAAAMLALFPTGLHKAGYLATAKTSQNILNTLPPGAIGPEDLVIVSDETDYSVPLFLGRRAALLGSAGELGFGMFAETHPGEKKIGMNPYDVSSYTVNNPYLLEYGRLHEKWKGPGRVWLFLKRKHHRYFDKENLPFFEAGSNAGTQLLTNREL